MKMPGDEIGGELRSEKKKKKTKLWRECLLLVLAVVRARRREDAPGGGVLGVGCARDDDPTSRPRGRSRVPRGFVAIPRWGDDHPGLGGCPSLRGFPGRRGGGARDAGGDANAPPARGGEEEDHHEVRHRDAAPIPRRRRPSPRPQPTPRSRFASNRQPPPPPILPPLSIRTAQAAARPGRARGSRPVHRRGGGDAPPRDDHPGVAVVVDPFLAKKLRPHQREGVRWMWRALHGLSPPRARARGDEKALSSRALSGCLLADDMGLGKSLQSLALVWTMLRQGPRGVPTARRALLVCPASLVGSWDAETDKWLGGVRAQAALAEAGAPRGRWRRTIGGRTRPRTWRVRARSTGGRFS